MRISRLSFITDVFKSFWTDNNTLLEGEMSFLKNTAVTGFSVGLVNVSDGSDITTGTPVGYYTLDGGTQTAIADVTPVHEGNGQWTFDLTAGEMNGDVVGLTFTHTSAKTEHFTIKTVTTDLHTICTETRLAELDAANIPADIDALTVSVGNISNGSAAISTIAASATVTTGTETLTYVVTNELDGILHEIADVANSTEFYYEFSVGGNGVPVEFTWNGYAQSNGDSYAVKAYNWGATAWNQIGTISGTSGTAIVENTFLATNAHVGTGANIGLVRLQFTSSDGTHFATDRVLCSYSVVAQSVGYANGAVWIDTNNGTAGTENFVNGVADNPVDSIADANTLSSQLGLNKFVIAPGSSITFAATQSGQIFEGSGWTLALGGQDISDSTIIGAAVSGVPSGTGSAQIYKDCLIGAASHLTNTHLIFCGLSGTQTMAEAGDIYFDACHSAIAGAGSVTLDFGAALNASNAGIRHHSGGWTIENMGAGTGTYNASFEGEGQITWAASCSASSNTSIRGHWKITDNAGGAVTETLDDNQAGVDSILVDTAEIGAAGAGLTDITINAASVDAVWDEATSGHNVGGSFGKGIRQVKEGTVSVESSVNDASATTTSFVTALTETTNDHYSDVSMIFIGGALVGQSRPILSYNGTTKTITLDEALTEAPANGDSFIIKTDHVHPITEIQNGLATEVKQDIIDTNVDTLITEVGTAGAGLTDLGGMSTGMKAEVNIEADTALTDYDGPTNAEMEARTPTAAQLAYIVSNAATGLPVTFTTSGGSTTLAVLNQVDSAAGSATDDQYNGRLLVFTDGTLKGVVTDITDYVGSTTTATITAIPFAPTSSHNARLI